MYQLQVRVVSGNNLPVGDLNGFSDPYIKLFWGGQTVKTSTKKKTLNPYWNETFTLTSSLANEPLKVSCYDWDRFTRDDVLGTGEVRTDDLVNKVEKPVTLHLSPRGEIQLRLTAINFPEHYGSTAGTTTYTTTSYIPMGGGGGGTVDDMLKQRFSMGYNSGAAPYMSTPAPYGSVGLAPQSQGPPSYYPPQQAPASYYPPPQQQQAYPASYMPTGGAPSSFLPGGYGGPQGGGYNTGAPSYGGAPSGYGGAPGGYGGAPGGGYGAPPAPGGYGAPPPAGYGTGAPGGYGAPPPAGGYPSQQYPPTGY